MAKAPPREASKGDRSGTLSLPRTPFPLKGDLPKREPEMLKRWEGLYEKLSRGRAGKASFVLHDGPPYANGAIHIGHALNKVLKDMVVRSRAVMGCQVHYRPGWDCRGLPIETALLKEKKSGPRGVSDVVEFRHEAAASAERWIGLQKEDFRRLGVLGDWDNPYKTMSRDYESATLRAFRLLLGQGYIYRGLKPVLWCVNCETALAEAEVEHKDKKSQAVFVAFPIKSPEPLRGSFVLVWTTTPWTLPANKAVAFNPELPYGFAKAKDGRRVLVAQGLFKKPDAMKKLGLVDEGSGTRQGREIAAAKLVCEAPFGGDSPAVLADYVTAEDGSGIVHTAPGHGADDFETGRKNHLDVLCPVDAAGRYTEEAGAFSGLAVLGDGNEAVIRALAQSGLLMDREEIVHSYPHCWRCKNPVIFRASEQWFMSVEKNGLRARLLAEIDKVRWIPDSSRSRIASMVGARPDWCLSRQRLWGTPIPVLYCAACGTWLGDDRVMKAIEEKVSRDGSDFWFVHRGAEITPQGWDFLPPETSCPSCGERRFRRETDILDVWLDSGVSWLSVLEGAGVGVPCDLYLEGSDQHRGWFQSSLLSAFVINGAAPYKAVLTHGFVLDENGRAMHKSLGNVVAPQEVISKFGADVLRLWVALSDWEDDVRLSADLLKGPVDAYRRVRNTLRYLLGNLSDFPPRAPGERAAPERERYVLSRLAVLEESVLEDYRRFAFRSAARRLVDFCAFDLSAFYFDVLKDRLYTFPKDHPSRRAAQRALADILKSLLPLLSPILPFTAEEAWGHQPREWGWGDSVALASLPARPKALQEGAARAAEPSPERWAKIFELREAVHKALEDARGRGIIGGSLEARIVLRNIPAAILEGEPLDWPEMFIVSQADLMAGEGAIGVEVAKAEGRKCGRCWRYQKDVGRDARHEDLCGRCVAAVAG